jgi:transcriptional regulator with XRE-family HTH domain
MDRKVLVVMQPVVEYDVTQMQRDMVGKGWQSSDLARRAGVSKSTVSRFFDGSFQTPPTAKKIAKALGFPLRRYLIELQATA